MFRSKTKVTTTVLLLGVLCVAAAVWTRQKAAAEPRDGKPEPSGVGAGMAEMPKCSAMAVEMKGPAGCWERVVGPYKFVLRFEGDRLFGTCTYREDKDTTTVMVEADYGVTRDSVLFGALTGVEIPSDPEAEVEASTMIDHAFSLRYRLDGDVLTIKDVKFDLVKDNGGDFKPALLIGRYKRKTACKEEPVQESRPRVRRNCTRCGAAPQPTPAACTPVAAPTDTLVGAGSGAVIGGVTGSAPAYVPAAGVPAR
jgi:hypothetical protein